VAHYINLKTKIMSKGSAAVERGSIGLDKGSDAVECGSIGLDIGTSHIVVYKKDKSETSVQIEPNVFLTLPSHPQTKKILTDTNIRFLETKKSFYVLGNYAEEFAGIMGGQTKQPMAGGVLNLGEDEGINVIHSILNGLIKPPKKENEPLYFSVPGKTIDSPKTVLFNESIFNNYLINLGYSPQSINEGMAVLMSELTDNNITGIGLSIGGGMCNICFSYLSIPVVTYSINMGGDYIDKMVANSIGVSPDKIKMIKENGLNLSRKPKNNIEHGLHACYDNLFDTVTESLERVLSTSDTVPILRQSIPMILSGGTFLATGSRDKFISALQKVTLPLEISDIILAKNPLHTTAKGAYLTATGKGSA